jgi:hypothetical protein
LFVGVKAGQRSLDLVKMVVSVCTNPPAEETIKTGDGGDVWWLQSDEKEEGDTGDRKW